MRKDIATHRAVIPAKAGIQYAAACAFDTHLHAILGRPVKPDDDSLAFCSADEKR